MKIKLRSAYSWIFGFAVLGVLRELYNGFFVKVADEKGWYVNAAERWDFFWSSISAFLVSPWISHCLALIAGAIIALSLSRLISGRSRDTTDAKLRTIDAFNGSIHVPENSADQPFVEITGTPLSGAWTAALKVADQARQTVKDLPAAQLIAEKMTREEELKYYCGILHKYADLHGIAPPTRTSERIPYRADRPLIFWNNGTQLDTIDEKGNGRFRYLHFKTRSLDGALIALREEMKQLSQDIPS
ncbi:hypothetical protein MUU53_14640 [Rhizobium lemnae]|uniref:Uncharacterized protein n=1 Tax=Rhizobium lemnae TaxID=1214924 RepID=A0ABV8E4T4_9HYPH|nr:hypothetical protein [Rhizobium lemnae]MCJ8509152.1 hypothetical protein [Rhizobium lemnae]